MSYLEDASGFTGTADRIVVARDEAEVLGGDRLRCASDHFGRRHRRHGRPCDAHPGFAHVGAGLLLRDLKAKDQFYAPDPTETWAALGGTIATNASGSRSFLYGSTRRHIRSLRVATMDGVVHEYMRGDNVDFSVPQLPVPNTTKHTAGYYLRPELDWIDLFIGSEGTLAIVLEADVLLLPTPPELITAVIFFASDAAALDAVDEWRNIPGLRMLEYMDANSLALPKDANVPTQAKAALFIEQIGDEPDDLLEQADALWEGSWFANSAADCDRFRVFRHALPERVNDTGRRNGSLKMGTDFAVPLDRNRDILAIYRDACERVFPGQYVIFGHIGDAHLHVNLLPVTKEQQTQVKELILQMARQAVALGGMVSAEHGIGKRGSNLLALQFNEEQIESMKSVKRRLDPEWRLGRGTLFPV